MKNSHIIKEKIISRRSDRLDWLKVCCMEASKLAEDTIKKIDSQGLAGNHSCNHDILRWAERINRVSYELWLLSDLQKMTDIDITPVLAEEDHGEKENESR